MKLEFRCPVVLVGGTNGKGSVCVLADEMLRSGGVRVCRYTSPHLLRFHERICINGEPVSDSQLLHAFAQVERAREASGQSLTYFEFTTLAAAWIFSQVKTDVVLLEVGLGGRLDAVNLFAPDVSLVTNIGMDHQEFLGDTLDQIATEKAGIFRPDCPAIIADANAPVSLTDAAQDLKAKLYRAGQEYHAEVAGSVWHYRGRRELFNLPMPAMRGRHQVANAAASLALLENLPEHLWPGTGAVRQGLHSARLSGRAQVLPGAPVTVLDVAHNAEAAMVLERMLFDMGYFPKTAAVLGMLSRKDPKQFAEVLQRRVDMWYIARPQGGDAAAEEVAQAVAAAGGQVQVCDTIASAARAAREYCGESGRIVVTGSFMTVADYIENAV